MNDNLRCGDEDRRHVEQVLTLAYADGRISREEHDERLTAVWEAKTFGQLRPITADLVALDQQVRQAVARSHPDGLPRAVVDPYDTNRKVDGITSILSSHKRIDGEWRLRERSRVLTVMGDVQLDLTLATFESNRCVIQLNCIMGELKLIVPAGVRVRDDVTHVMSEYKERGVLPEDGAPEILIKGMCVMGSIKVEGPNRKNWKQRLLGK